MVKGKKNKKAQATIFIIVAVVIIAGVLIFLFVSDTGRSLVNQVFGGEIDIKGELETCINNNDKINEKISLISSQGGEIEPNFYYTYKGNNLEYLCYTNAYYQTCYMQKPFLIQEVETEIKDGIESEVKLCFNNLKDKLDKRGYSVSSGAFDFSLELIPEYILININNNFVAKRADTIKRFDGFQIRRQSKLYELTSLSTSILSFEARYGEADPLVYMILYPDIKVEKLKQGYGTTIYLVSDRNTLEEFNFAVRSLVFPPGYYLQ